MADEKELINKLANNEIKLHELDKYTSDINETISLRKKFIESIFNIDLSHISNYSIDMNEANKKNIENPIGTIQIPLGLAGPVKINGEHAQGNFYIPLATTEGALIASINRGCSTISKSGGANVRVIDDKMTRAPALQVDSITDAIIVKRWIESHIDEIKKEAENTTSHGKLLKIDPIIIVGRYIYPRFVYSTGDSMGMNMVTIATEAALKFISDNINVHVLASSGNVCVDKKPSAINLIEGRGKTVIAEVIIPKHIVNEKLKTTVESINEVNMAKNFLGSAISGSMGFNAHFANMIGAIFLATGQDEAHIVEGSLGITVAEEENGDLYFSVTIPDLPIATFGGGTRIETAQECLKIIGSLGTGKVYKFAEIIGVTVLAGELSLIAALSAGHLARAHQELGRG